jgi:hypothetical protein
VRVSFSLGPTLQSFFDQSTRESLFPTTGLLSVELQVRNFFRRDWLWGLDLSSGQTDSQVVRLGTALPFRYSEFTAGTTMAVEWPLLHGRLAPSCGVRFAYMLLGRKFQETSIPDQYFSTFSPGLVLGLNYRFTDSFAAIARGRIHYLLYNVGADRTSLGYWESSTGLSYEF